MIDIGLEVFRAFVLAGLVFFLWRAGKNRFGNLQPGWRVVLAGFLLLLFGSALDITDNFERLNRYVVIGDTETESNEPSDFDFENPVKREVREFVEAVLNDIPVTIPGEEGLRVVRLVDAARRSALEGCVIEV